MKHFAVFLFLGLTPAFAGQTATYEARIQTSRSETFRVQVRLETNLPLAPTATVESSTCNYDDETGTSTFCTLTVVRADIGSASQTVWLENETGEVKQGDTQAPLNIEHLADSSDAIQSPVTFIENLDLTSPLLSMDMGRTFSLSLNGSDATQFPIEAQIIDGKISMLTKVLFPEEIQSDWEIDQNDNVLDFGNVVLKRVNDE